MRLPRTVAVVVLCAIGYFRPVFCEVQRGLSMPSPSIASMVLKKYNIELQSVPEFKERVGSQRRQVTDYDEDCEGDVPVNFDDLLNEGAVKGQVKRGPAVPGPSITSMILKKHNVKPQPLLESEKKTTLRYGAPDSDIDAMNTENIRKEKVKRRPAIPGPQITAMILKKYNMKFQPAPDSEKQSVSPLPSVMDNRTFVDMVPPRPSKDGIQNKNCQDKDQRHNKTNGLDSNGKVTEHNTYSGDLDETGKISLIPTDRETNQEKGPDSNGKKTDHNTYSEDLDKKDKISLIPKDRETNQEKGPDSNGKKTDHNIYSKDLDKKDKISLIPTDRETNQEKGPDSNGKKTDHNIYSEDLDKKDKISLIPKDRETNQEKGPHSNGKKTDHNIYSEDLDKKDQISLIPTDRETNQEKGPDSNGKKTDHNIYSEDLDKKDQISLIPTDRETNQEKGPDSNGKKTDHNAYLEDLDKKGKISLVPTDRETNQEKDSNGKMTDHNKYSEDLHETGKISLIPTDRETNQKKGPDSNGRGTDHNTYSGDLDEKGKVSLIPTDREINKRGKRIMFLGKKDKKILKTTETPQKKKQDDYNHIKQEPQNDDDWGSFLAGLGSSDTRYDNEKTETGYNSKEGNRDKEKEDYGVKEDLPEDMNAYVVLLELTFTSNYKKHRTGTVIHDHVVITAAHAFQDSTNRKNNFEISLSFVIIGSKHAFERGSQQYLPIEKVLMHPEYKGWNADIALVYTYVGVKSDYHGFSLPIQGHEPVILATSNLVVASWGQCNNVPKEAMRRTQYIAKKEYTYRRNQKITSRKQSRTDIKSSGTKRNFRAIFDEMSLEKNSKGRSRDSIPQMINLPDNDDGEILDYNENKELNRRKEMQIESKYIPNITDTKNTKLNNKQNKTNIYEFFTKLSKTEVEKIKLDDSFLNATEIFEYYKNKILSDRKSRRSMTVDNKKLVAVEFQAVNEQHCQSLVAQIVPSKYNTLKGNQFLCFTSSEHYLTRRDAGAPVMQDGKLVAVTAGGIESEGNYFGVGIKLSCFCNWIADNLPGGGKKINCCTDCCGNRNRKRKFRRRLLQNSNVKPRKRGTKMEFHIRFMPYGDYSIE